MTIIKCDYCGDEINTVQIVLPDGRKAEVEALVVVDVDGVNGLRIDICMSCIQKAEPVL